MPVALPVQRQIVDYEEYPGKIMAVERVSLMAQANGYLTAIRFQPALTIDADTIDSGAAILEELFTEMDRAGDWK